MHMRFSEGSDTAQVQVPRLCSCTVAKGQVPGPGKWHRDPQAEREIPFDGGQNGDDLFHAVGRNEGIIMEVQLQT